MNVVVVRAVKPNDELDVMATKVVKTEKVKPNYKRKLATERDKVKRKYSNKKDKGFPYLFIPLFTGIIISGEWKNNSLHISTNYAIIISIVY